MEYKNMNTYKSSKFMSPPGDRDKLSIDKGSQWYIAHCQALMNGYLNNRFVYGKDSDFIKKLRAYANGEQGNTKVKEKLLRKQKDGTFKGRMKDVFQTTDILPEMLDIVASINLKSTYDISSVAIDESSVSEKNLEKELLKFVIDKNTQEFLKFTGVKVQTPISEEDIAGLNDSDIDLIYESGGVQLIREMASIAVCNKTKAESSHTFVEEALTRDSIDLGIVGTKVYFDYSDACVKYRNVEIDKVLLPKSKYKDFRDITRCGEIVFMSLVDIVSQVPDLKFDDLEELIRGCMDYNKSFEYSLFQEYGQSYFNYENSIFDDFKVPVLDAEWLATDYTHHIEGQHKSGGLIRNKVKHDYKLSKDDRKAGRKIDRKKFIKRYECLWVIGTEILLKAEQSKHVSYYGKSGNKIPKSDYSFVTTGKASIVKRCITDIDDINLYDVKLRNDIATIPPGPAMIIYEHALQNVSYNGIKQKQSDLIASLLESGVMVVNSKDEKGNLNTSNGGKVVEFIPSGILEKVQVFERAIQSKIGRLRQVIGLPEGLDGTNANPYQALGQTQLAAASSSNALYPTLSLTPKVFEMTYDKVVRKWQSVAKGGKDIKVEHLAIPDHTVKVFSLTEEFSNSDFNIRISYGPTEEERNNLMQQINEMSAAYIQSNGAIGCNKSEYFLLYNLIKAGRIKDVGYRIARIEKQRDILNLKKEQANIQANAEAQQQSTITAQEQLRITESIKGDEARKTAAATAEAQGAAKIAQEFVKGQGTEVKNINMADVQQAIAVIMGASQQIQAQNQAQSQESLQNFPEQEQQQIPQEEMSIGQ